MKTNNNQIKNLIEKEKEVIKFLARIEDVKCVEAHERKAGEVSLILSFGELFVDLTDLIDIKKEIERLEKERKKIVKKLDQVSKKLCNKSFLEKAPREVVEKEKKIKKEVEEKLAKIERYLNELKNAGS